MKTFLSSTKAKIIAAAITSAVIAAVVTSIIFINLGYRTIAVKAFNGITKILNEGKENLAYEGLHLKSGDDVTVSQSADLTLSLDEDKYVYAEPNTHFWLEASGQLGDTRTTVHLEEGSQLIRIDNKLVDEEYFDVETPNSTMSVRGTVFRVSCYKDENGEWITSVEVFEGEVYTEAVREDGQKTGEARSITADKCAKIHSNPAISEFVVDENGEDVVDIDYSSLPQGAAEFLGEAIDEGRDIPISKELLYDYTEINEHVFDDMTDLVPPTCETEGSYIQVCSVCGKKSKEKTILPKLEHKIVEEEIPATDDAPARTLQKCSECGQILVEIEKVPQTPSSDEPSGSASSRAENTTTSSSSSTAKTTSSSAKPASSSAKTSSSTVRTTGSSSSTVRPSTSSSTTTPSSSTDPCKNGHDFSVLIETQDATCTEDGYKLYKCSRCNTRGRSASGSKLGHNFSTVTEDEDATCTADGYVIKKCSRCSETQRTTTDKKLGHDYSEDTAKYKAATCTAAGSRTYICSRCKKSYDSKVQALGHNFDPANTSITKPTCTSAGSETTQCTRCSEAQTKVLAKLDHNYIEDTSKSTAATCTQEGSTVKVCSGCGDEQITVDSHFLISEN